VCEVIVELYCSCVQNALGCHTVSINDGCLSSAINYCSTSTLKNVVVSKYDAARNVEK